MLESLSNKVANSNTGVFLWILRNFKNTFFRRKPPDDCFSIHAIHFSLTEVTYENLTLQFFVNFEVQRISFFFEWLSRNNSWLCIIGMTVKLWKREYICFDFNIYMLNGYKIINHYSYTVNIRNGNVIKHFIIKTSRNLDGDCILMLKT